MKQYYLAVDIGASGGRHILGTIMNGKMMLEEVYRFPNGMINNGGVLCWVIRGNHGDRHLSRKGEEPGRTHE